MNFDIRAGVARLSSRPMAPNEDSNAFEQAVLQFNTLLVAAKVAYPDNLDILALKPFEHPSIVKSIVFSDSVFRLTDALEYLPEANSTGTQLISDKFGILLSDKQLKKDFEAYQDAVNGMGLLFFDIDKFKLLNTKYTETIVDRDLLIIYQRMILDLVRHRGFAYSVGGDEFIILLLNVSQEETISFANRLIEATRKTEFCVANDTIQITISVGVACYPTDSDTYQTLRELANSAENKAKANGRDQVFFSGQKTTNLEIHTPGQSESDKDTQTVKVFPESTVFFYERFCSAFPGVRGIHWFNDADEAIARLSRLLQPPLSLIKDNHNGCLSPIWWWRGGNLHIQKFRKMDGSIVLLDWNELKIEKIAAVNPGSYYQCFVYVQAAQMEPIGLYPRTEEQLAGCLETFGYCSEEYGLLENKHIVSRAEYDDGAAMINGQLTDFNGEIELRVRYVTPYNFIIAAQDCPINNLRFDQKLEELMNDLLVKKVSLEQVVKIISQLPKREHRG